MDTNNLTSTFLNEKRKMLNEFVEMLGFHITHTLWDLSQKSWVEYPLLLHCWRVVVVLSQLLKRLTSKTIFWSFLPNSYLWRKCIFVPNSNSSIQMLALPTRCSSHRKWQRTAVLVGDLICREMENCHIGPRLDAS